MKVIVCVGAHRACRARVPVSASSAARHVDARAPARARGVDALDQRCAIAPSDVAREADAEQAIDDSAAREARGPFADDLAAAPRRSAPSRRALRRRAAASPVTSSTVTRWKRFAQVRRRDPGIAAVVAGPGDHEDRLRPCRAARPRGELGGRAARALHERRLRARRSRSSMRRSSRRGEERARAHGVTAASGALRGRSGARRVAPRDRGRCRAPRAACRG